MYILWHDQDYDLARWVYLNSSLKSEESILRPIPSNNSINTLLRCLDGPYDHHILPLIKYDAPDIIIQKINEREKDSKILFVTELMTHTPQHHHPLQRFSRIYSASANKVPVALLIPGKKVKLERRGGKYRPTSYRTNPLVYHIFLKTTEINKTPTLMFMWPDHNGYLKYDKQHPSAPLITEQIGTWFKFLDTSINVHTAVELIDLPVVKAQTAFMLSISGYKQLPHKDFINQWELLYKLETIQIMPTQKVIAEYTLDRERLSSRFRVNELSLIFEPGGLKAPSSPFRTDPYAGMLCAFDNLFCRDINGQRIINLILRAKNIEYATSESKNIFMDFKHDQDKCPFLKKVSQDIAQAHIRKDECPFTRTKQQRIYGDVADIIIFEDSIYYNDSD